MVKTKKNPKKKKNLVVVEEMLRNTEPGQEGVESFHYPEKDLIEMIFYLVYRLKQILSTLFFGNLV